MVKHFWVYFPTSTKRSLKIAAFPNILFLWIAESSLERWIFKEINKKRPSQYYKLVLRNNNINAKSKCLCAFQKQERLQRFESGGVKSTNIQCEDK